MDDRTLNKIISIVRNYIAEEGMGVGAIANATNPPNQINIAGLPPDTPPVGKRKNAYLGKGSRSRWMQRRKPPQ